MIVQNLEQLQKTISLLTYYVAKNLFSLAPYYSPHNLSCYFPITGLSQILVLLGNSRLIFVPFHKSKPHFDLDMDYLPKYKIDSIMDLNGILG